MPRDEFMYSQRPKKEVELRDLKTNETILLPASAPDTPPATLFVFQMEYEPDNGSVQPDNKFSKKS